MLALGSLCALGLSAGIVMAEAQLRAKLNAWNSPSEQRLDYGALTLDLRIPMAVKEVSLNQSSTQAPQVTISEIQTDLGLLDVAQGKRRPSHVEITGLRAALTVGSNGIVGWDEFVQRIRSRRITPAPELGDQAPPRIALVLNDGQIQLNTTLPGLPFGTVRLTHLSAKGWIAGLNHMHLEGEAFLIADTIGTKVLFSVETGAQANVQIHFPEHRFVLPLMLGGKKLWLAFQTLTRDTSAGTTRLDDVTVMSTKAKATIETLTLEDRAKGLRPSLAALRAITMHELELTQPERSASVKQVTLKLRAHQRIGAVLPIEPRRLDLTGLVTRLAPGLGLGAAEAHVDALTLTFDDKSLTKLMSSQPLDTIASLAVTRPTLQLIVPSGKGLQSLPGYATLRSLLSPREAPTTQPKVLPNPRPPLDTSTLARLAQLGVRLDSGRLIIADPEGKEIFKLDKARFRVTQRDANKLRVDIGAEVTRSGLKTGRFELQFDSDRAGQLKSVTGSVTGKDFAHLASRFSEHIDVPPDAEIDVAFAYNPSQQPEGAHQLTGTARLRNFGVTMWRIAHEPLRQLDAGIDFSVTHHAGRHHTTIAIPRLRLGQATLALNADITRQPHDGTKFELSIEMPEQDCGKVAASIPPQFIPRLPGFAAKGRMAFKMSVNGDMDSPKAAKLEVTGDLDQCQVLEMGPNVDFPKLRRDFVHHPIEPKAGVRDDISLGRGTRQWVRSSRLPEFVKAAAIVTEDRGFHWHRGVRWELVLRALRINLMHRRFVYGGSTITQQLVKNLYLTREKTLARKLEELIIAWQMEQAFSKDEILTLYLNLIEYGPNIYGIKHASRFYFGKRPGELSPLEAAFIMALKPFPRGGYAQWEKGHLNKWWIKRVTKVLNMMRRRERAITHTEVSAAAPYQPDFRARDESYRSGTPYVRPRTIESGTFAPSP